MKPLKIRGIIITLDKRLLAASLLTNNNIT